MATWSDGVLDRLDTPILDAVRDLTGVWVVGGAVRDALLGVTPHEIDLLVEGDAEAVARRLGSPSAKHERFGTFSVGGVDVAAARREIYPVPGALPHVELGATVAEDLARRDFTVNALAVRVHDGAGEAWTGALEDLEARQLRVLHDRSFVDDPTRVLRMARYVARLGLTVEEHTTMLARRVQWTTSGARVGAELLLAAGEPAGVWRELERWRVPVDGFAAPDFELTGLAGLGACLLDAPHVEASLDALGFPGAERSIVAAASHARVLATRLQAADTPSQVAEVASRQPDEALAVAAALGAEEPVRRWREEWSRIEPAVTGHDLTAAGLKGPAVGAGLRAARAAALDEGADRERQLAAALEGHVQLD
jgi:tRNA nucleotidyltransferase (CCA-adding enzyme)